MKHSISLIAILAAVPAFAEDARQLEAHEHGVGALNIAIDGTTVAMEFDAPGADIVGFEYEAESDADLAAIDAAIATLGAPLDLFILPEAAGCSVTEASAELEGEDDHDDHDDDHGHDDHDGDHADHDEEEHDDHDGDHADHGEEGHDDHAHDDHADEAGHTEFRATYTLTCETPDAIDAITFAYFDSFPNAREVEVQLITASGAQPFEVERDAPVLTISQ